MKEYYEIRIFTEKEELDMLTNNLETIGIEGFVIEDPEELEIFLEKKNIYDWDYIDESVMELKNKKLNVTFYVDKDDQALYREVKETYKDAEIKILCDDEWKDNWKEYFKPTRISERISVVPTWEDYKAKSEDELIINIDPGMAFGTGTHETTTLCVKLLEKYMKKGDCVLDVGCGSGILSVAAGLLGASRVLGVDIDSEAVRVSKENITLNREALVKAWENDIKDPMAQNAYEGRKLPVIDIQKGDLIKGIDIQADIVVANLMADLVIMLSGSVPKHLKGKSIYISSGILVEKKEKVAAAVIAAGFEIAEIVDDGEWCAICAKYTCANDTAK